MATIVLIGCSSSKLAFPAQAQHLYSPSALFRYSVAYARQLEPDAIYILSAKYGLLGLEDRIEPYNETLAVVSREKRLKKPELKVLNAVEKVAWGERVQRQLSERTDVAGDQFVCLAGRSYIKLIEAAIRHRSEPLVGMRHGERLAWLQTQVGG